jgi:hypothetical protein
VSEAEPRSERPMEAAEEKTAAATG